MQESFKEIYRQALCDLAGYRGVVSSRAQRHKQVWGNALWQATAKTKGKKQGSRKPQAGSSESKGFSSEGGNGGGGSGPSWNDVMQAGLMLALLLAFSNLSSGSSPGAGLETIDFQTFRNNILARDMVDKVSSTRGPFASHHVKPLLARCLSNKQALHPYPMIHLLILVYL